MNDDELFELCKEVSEALGWAVDEDSNLTRKWGYNGIGNLQIEPIQGGIFTGQVPLYTSDYVLEKLKEFFKDKKESSWFRYDGENWSLSADDIYDGPRFSVFKSDTLLKNLLKLTIALHEAGELPINNKTEEV